MYMHACVCVCAYIKQAAVITMRPPPAEATATNETKQARSKSNGNKKKSTQQNTKPSFQCDQQVRARWSEQQLSATNAIIATVTLTHMRSTCMFVTQTRTRACKG